MARLRHGVAVLGCSGAGEGVAQQRRGDGRPANCDGPRLLSLPPPVSHRPSFAAGRHDNGGGWIHRRDDGGGQIHHRGDGETGSAAAVTVDAESAAATMGEAGGEGSDGDRRVGADPVAALLGLSSTTVKEVDPAAAATMTTMSTAPRTATTITMARLFQPPPLYGLEYRGVGFGRQRPW